MKKLLNQIKWEFKLLQRNNIISISIAVTLVYAIILFSLKSLGNLDKPLVGLVLNDPTVIGYFFIAIAIYTEIKHQILPAIFVTPVSLHTYLLSKTIALSIVGAVCALGLAISVKGFDFDIITYLIGAFGICVISTLLGIIMMTFADDFLKFGLISAPLFLIVVNVPLLQYLKAIDLGVFIHLFPIQGALDLIDASISGTQINYWLAYLSIALMILLFYWLAFNIFNKKIVQQ